MQIIQFNKEIRSGIDNELKELASFLGGKSVTLVLTKSSQNGWYLGLPDRLTHFPQSIKILSNEVPIFPDFNPKYWLYRPMYLSGKIVRISGKIIQNFIDAPWEELFRIDDDFKLKVIVSNDQGVPISDIGKIVSIEISTDNELIAKTVSNWISGEYSTKRQVLYIYSSEFIYLFRPPISQTSYFPEGTLSKTDHFSEIFAKKPENLKTHCLICGQSGSGKTNTNKFILDQVMSNHNLEGILLLDVKGEYKTWASKNQVRYLNIGLNPELLKILNINPFIPPDMMRLKTHIDNLSQVFAIFSFGGAGAVLPSYMRLLLYEFYRALWQIDEESFSNILFYTGKKLREKGFRFSYADSEKNIFLSFFAYWKKYGNTAFNNIVSGNSGKQIGDIAGILSARIKTLEYSLLRFFNYSEKSISFDKLLNSKLVISLQGASQDDINLIVSLLSIYFTAIANLREETPTLLNLFVIEEAHRVMGKININSDFNEAGSELAKNMEEAIAELRAKGVGIIIVDQSPSKLIPGVITNTGTKIIHRISSSSDQDILEKSMGFSSESDFTKLEKGECFIQTESGQMMHDQIPIWES